MKKTIILTLSCLLLYSCNNKPPKNVQTINNFENQELYINYGDSGTNVFEMRILQHRDTDAYEIIFGLFNGVEKFPYALYLANKCNYAKANYNIYNLLYESYNYPKIQSIANDTIENYLAIVTQKLKLENKLNAHIFDSISYKGFVSHLSTVAYSGYYKSLKFYELDYINNYLAMKCLREASESNCFGAKGEYGMAKIVGCGTSQNIKEGLLILKDHYQTAEPWQKKPKIRKQIAKELTDVMRANALRRNKLEYTTLCVKSLIPSDISCKIESGDTLAYEQLKKDYYLDKNFELLLFSILMADRYNYKPAYYDVYNYLWQTFNYNQKRNFWDLSQFDITTKKYALYHLKKSASFGNKQAISILSHIN